jgi:HEPN/RES N-terminal domain 1
VRSDDINELKVKRICFACVGDKYLSDEIRAKGKRAKCSYCKKTRRTYSVGELAERVDTAFQQHYVRTSDQPNDWEYMLLRDRESNYEWYRHGEPVIDTIMNAADIPQAAADDIQKILADEYEDFDLAAMGEETEFANDSYYEERGASDEAWQEEWRSFENSLKTEARFLCPKASRYIG